MEMSIPKAASVTSQVVLRAKIKYYNTITAANTEENIVVLVDRQVGKPPPVVLPKVAVTKLRYEVAQVGR